MGILKKIFNPTSSKPFNLISAVEQHDTKNIIRHLESKSLPKNPAAIPYTAEAIMKDLDIIYEFQKIYNPTHDEFAAAIAIKMLHLTMKSTMDWLAKNSYDSPPLEHMIYIGTFLTIYNVIDYCSQTQAVYDHLWNCSYPINELLHSFLDLFTGVKKYVVYY